MEAKRTKLGPAFSEGARMLWLIYEKRFDTITEFAEEIGCPKGSLHRWMYGERRPSLRWSVKIQSLYRIEPAKFMAASSACYVPPHGVGDA